MSAGRIGGVSFIYHATAADLAHIYRVPIGTIYRWASEDQWRRTRTAHPVRYNAHDAQASYDRRRRKESQVEIRPQQNGGAVVVIDLHEGTYKIPFGPGEWETFVARVKAGEFDRAGSLDKALTSGEEYEL